MFEIKLPVVKAIFVDKQLFAQFKPFQWMLEEDLPKEVHIIQLKEALEVIIPPQYQDGLFNNAITGVRVRMFDNSWVNGLWIMNQNSIYIKQLRAGG